VERGDVVYVCGEGAFGLKRLVAAWRQTRTNDVPGFRVLPQSVSIVDSAKNLAREILAAKLMPHLIVIDTLNRCFGGHDENSTEDMGKFIKALDAMREMLPGITILVVHHAGKDTKRGERGSTALRGAADTMMRLASAKAGSRLTLRCDKQKDGEEFREIRLSLKVVNLPLGGTSCVITSAKAAINDGGGKNDPRAEDNDRLVLEALARSGEAGASYSDWKCASGLPPSTFKDVRKRLIAAGKVVEKDDHYFLSPTGPEAGTGAENQLPAAA
jgi:hypothetical protein